MYRLRLTHGHDDSFILLDTFSSGRSITRRQEWRKLPKRRVFNVFQTIYNVLNNSDAKKLIIFTSRQRKHSSSLLTTGVLPYFYSGLEEIVSSEGQIQ